MTDPANRVWLSSPAAMETTYFVLARPTP